MPTSSDSEVYAALSKWIIKTKYKGCTHCGEPKITHGKLTQLPAKPDELPLDVIPLICASCSRVEFLSASKMMEIAHHN